MSNKEPKIVKATQIKTDGTEIPAEFKGEPSYQDCYPYVATGHEVGWSERVSILNNEGKRAVMMVNENGLALGLPFNLKGTRLYHNYAEKVGMVNDSPIVGDVLLFEEGFDFT